jgi:putative iron-only hydrogenase system regulator
MASKIYIIGIMVENFESTNKINDILHEKRCNVLGRLGLPNAKGNTSVISIVLDEPEEQIADLTERLSSLPGVRVATLGA